MDDDTADLVDQLCTRIGMIMEDASAVALGTGRPPSRQRAAVVAELQVMARKIFVLAEAAKVLTEPEEPLSAE